MSNKGWSFVSSEIQRWSLLMENFMKLVLVSHTAFSLWVYITRLHEGTLPPQVISLKTLHFQKCVFFFCIRRTCRLTTSESDGAAEKWLPPWQAHGPCSNISTFFSVNLWRRVDRLCCCFITTMMTNLHNIMRQQRGYSPLKQQPRRYI